MTDKTPATDPVVHTAAPGASAPASAPADPVKARPAKRGNGPLVTALIIVILLAVGLGYALWKQRTQFVSAGREVATRIDTLTADVAQARKDTREALALAQAQAGRVGELEDTVRETQSQYNALQQAWQNFNDSASDELLANDVERLLTIGNQQLRLAGNVSNAIVALETAQARLARADRPRFSSLQQAINGDLDRLRAVSTVDIPAQSARIERLVALVNKAPLLVPDSAAPGMVATGDAQPAAAPAPTIDPQAGLPADAPWWQRWRAEVASWPGRAGSALAHELGGLITIQRVDEPAALLLSPEQADQVRGTLRQRLLTVQLAMLMRQPAVWKSELDNVGVTLSKYFDSRSPDTVAAQTLARELAQTDIAVRMPDVADSLNAVAALRAAGFKNSGQD
ncbi:heme biosynthesis operon protein HemX [Achromobacter sp. LC458]|uniref:Heme biosynthesis operon protein HemX n=1 Tax=Achromobacter spanius TaxID=217203 RepID=A0A2S5GVS7_9BURK|nr:MULTISPECIES: uroporphyrinogen-III C-methyltransferase [Achromobacter]AYD67509.1 heme biosynthesis operon protein HemX [Achromobacter sp. B7]MDX3988273.1 uroporphyrinogen-III C-methyltransferase [Achromobacter sp.]PPA77068.1 heme biosynthesis operon protein HemX [Achromobacter spanius]QYJ23166.1 uroporphyrinogen-III C-methyltransferase [Achromobacter sp. ES-001]TRM55072.1 heme biosynthesis operon protein HemX [Achromobacter sp. LC458]